MEASIPSDTPHPVRPSLTGVIYGCPLSGSSYTEALYSAARCLGMDVRDAVWAGRWLLLRLKPGDTLHLHWPSFLYYTPASRWWSFIHLLRFLTIGLLLRARGVRFVWTAHNLYPHDGGKQEWMHRVARRFLASISYRIFVHGPTPARLVGAEFGVPQARLAIIPHGHWVGAYPNTITRVEARRKIGLPATGSKVLLFFGLCKPYKGLETLIASMSALPADTVLVVAGMFPSKDYERKIKVLAASVSGARVTIVPEFVNDADLQVFFNAADVVVLPYREILTSGAAMLAMSFGRPVVAPSMGSLIDVIDARCGVLYDPDEPDGLSRGLVQAVSAQFDSAAIAAHVATNTWEDAALALRDAHENTRVAPRSSLVSVPTKR